MDLNIVTQHGRWYDVAVQLTWLLALVAIALQQSWQQLKLVLD